VDTIQIPAVIARQSNGRSRVRSRRSCRHRAIVTLGPGDHSIALIDRDRGTPHNGAMAAALHRPRPARALILGLVLAGLLASAASARQADVISVSIVTDPASGKAVMQPDALKAADGDTIRFCNKSNVVAQIFSLSRFNSFGRTSGSGVRLDRGACTTVTLHNPTDGDLRVRIGSEIQNSAFVNLTVSPACKRSTQSALTSCSKPGTFVLASSELTDNPYGKEVTANAGTSGSGTWTHCCDGGQWKIQYTWKFPSTLTPGKAFTIAMSLKTLKVVPSQPLADQMTALAPDFRQDLTTQYPGQPSRNKTYTVPFSKAFATDPNFKVIKLYVGFAHATVVFTYKRT
jgi:hypothetical protein